MKDKSHITQKRLKELLVYDPTTGIFKWRIDYHRMKKGTITGKKPKENRYITITLDCRPYQAYRLAILYTTGSNPSGVVDHINRIRHDNRISNLRDVSEIDNARNRPRSRLNSSGITGVGYVKSSNEWNSTICSNNTTVSLGKYNNKHDAIMARYAGELSLNWHKTNDKTDAKLYVDNFFNRNTENKNEKQL